MLAFTASAAAAQTSALTNPKNAPIVSAASCGLPRVWIAPPVLQEFLQLSGRSQCPKATAAVALCSICDVWCTIMWTVSSPRALKFFNGTGGPPRARL